MKLIPFDRVREQLALGMALPWSIRNSKGELLLAKGLPVTDPQMLNALQERGAFVDASEFAQTANKNARNQNAPGGLVERWADIEEQLASLLRSPVERLFLQRIQEVAVHVAAAAHQRADEVIYLIVRHDHAKPENYGIVHSLHTAALCGLTARRLGWTNSKTTSLMCAALTMNISILALQGTLAARGGPMTPAERQEIESHPTTSARVLRMAGLHDEDWIEAVAQHHEVPGGTGYPAKIAAPGEMSQLLRLVDMFSAKHSPRRGRSPMSAQRAARDMLQLAKSNPFVNVLIKELGIYPPGCCVRLANEELGIVVRVGSTALAPVVSVVANGNGTPLSAPVFRDTSQKQYAVIASLTEAELGSYPAMALLLQQAAPTVL